MTLHVSTAHISYRGPGRLDITRGSGNGKGDRPFAPSWGLLRWAKQRLRDGVGEDEVWHQYRDQYLEEMRLSKMSYPDAWQAPLARHRVVLCCYCHRRERCHRGLLAELLVGLGAVDEGEIEPEPERQLGLPLDPRP